MINTSRSESGHGLPLAHEPQMAAARKSSRPDANISIKAISLVTSDVFMLPSIAHRPGLDGGHAAPSRISPLEQRTALPSGSTSMLCPEDVFRVEGHFEPATPLISANAGSTH